MLAEEKLDQDLRVLRVVPKLGALEVRNPTVLNKNLVVSINGSPPPADCAPGTIIKAGTSLRFAWNLARIPKIKSASALQAFCLRDYFRVKATLGIVRGGPGTGKSYVRNQIVKKLVLRSVNTVCLGPTGLVARSMPSGLWAGKAYPAQTVAMFLQHPPRSSVDMLHVIIDEYVMVSSRDLQAVWTLMLSLSRRGRLTLFGDHAQLWPVSGLPPWSSTMLRAAYSSGKMAVWQLTAQKRFGSCKRMLALVESLRGRNITALEAQLLHLARRPAPALGSCRLVAATNARAAPANVRVHNALKTLEDSGCTIFFGGTKHDELTLCNRERVRICVNKWTTRADGSLKEYEYCNGQEGHVQNLPGGTVTVGKDTRVSLRLLSGDVIQVLPVEMGSADAAAPTKKRRKRSRWTFTGVLKPSSGQTAHTVQGSTFNKSEACIVDLHGFPDSIHGYHMLIVALSRVQDISKLFIVNYDPRKIARMSDACACGCISSGPHALEHNESRLKAYEDHLDALKTHVRALYVP